MTSGPRTVAQSGLLRLASAVALLASASTAAFSQAVPDPAVVIGDQAQERADALARETTPRQTGSPIVTDPVVRADLPAPGGPTIALRTVRFEPRSEFLTDAELAAIAARYEGRQVDFAQISALVREVNDLYAEKGVVTAGAVLPPQTLAEGELVVQLVEGRLGAAAIVGDRRTRDDFILDRVRLTRGDNVVDVLSAAEDITYFNRVSSAQLRLLLEPGDAFGLTDVLLGVSEPPPHLLQIQLDNEGVSSTGEFQGSVAYRGYGLAGIDDSLIAQLTASQGGLAGIVNADAPISPSGTRVALGYTGSAITVVGGPGAQLGITGASQSGTLSLTQPLVADERWTLLALGSASYGVSSSELAGLPLVDSETVRTAIGFALTHSTETAQFTVQPQLVYANTNDRILNAWRDVVLLTTSFNGSLRITDEVRLTTRGAVQYTDAQLLPGNLLFQLGGPTTIRGFPSAGVGGDTGYFAQTELHVDLSNAIEGLGLVGFVDAGEVFSTFTPRTTLISAGAGLRYDFDGRISAELTVGIPLTRATPDQSGFAVYTRVIGRAF